jgi:hypothetical protein
MPIRGHVENGVVVLDEPIVLADGTAVIVEPSPSPNSKFWQTSTIDELANQQGVARLENPDALLGGWPADEVDDGFESALAEWRTRELERH